MYYNVTIDIITEIDTKQGPKEKRIKKHLLISAVSVTDAEAKAHTLFSSSTLQFEVMGVTQSKIEEVVE